MWRCGQACRIPACRPHHFAMVAKVWLRSTLNDIAWNYEDCDYSVIKEIVVAKVNVTATQGKRSVNREIEITMTKENGNWKVLYIE